MPRGGKRANAGRPLLAKNRRLLDWRGPLLIDPAELKVMSPLGYMLAVMRDPDAPPEQRFKAAVEAAPYCHAQHAKVDVSVSGQVDLLSLSDEALLRAVERSGGQQLTLDAVLAPEVSH